MVNKNIRLLAVIAVGSMFLNNNKKSRPSGKVKWFNAQKGYGFIEPEDGGNDIFVHISAVEKAGMFELDDGQYVEFEIVENNGKQSAENLKQQ